MKRLCNIDKLLIILFNYYYSNNTKKVVCHSQKTNYFCTNLTNG